jgi:hypothetical protein
MTILKYIQYVMRFFNGSIVGVLLNKSDTKINK